MLMSSLMLNIQYFYRPILMQPTYHKTDELVIHIPTRTYFLTETINENWKIPTDTNQHRSMEQSDIQLLTDLDCRV